MGRKSLAKERTTQILDAFEACIVDLGLAGATLQQVADRAGVRLSVIDHYIGKRDALITAMVTRFIEAYRQETAAFLQALPEDGRLATLLDLYFSEAGIFYRPQDSIILAELTVLGEHDPAVKQQIYTLYRSMEASFYQEIGRVQPEASEIEKERAAYLLLSLWLGHASLRWLGFSSQNDGAVRTAASQLLPA